MKSLYEHPRPKELGRIPMILVLTSSYPSHPQDYRGVFVKRLAESICRQGLSVRVLAPLPPHGESQAASTWSEGSQDRQPSLQLVHFGRRGGRQPYGSLYGGSGILDNLERQPLNLVHLPPSLVHMHQHLCRQATDTELIMAHWLLPSGLVAAYGRRKHGRPVWVVCHSGGVHLFGSLPWAVRMWASHVLDRGCDLLSFTTPALRDRFLDLVGPYRRRLLHRCRILPMGVDSAAFSSVQHDITGPVTVVARLDRLKAIDRLIEIAAELPQPPALRIVGDGPCRAKLDRLARRLPIDAAFWGEAPPDQVSQALHGSALAALPSRRLLGGRSEGFPVFAIEALAGGLPLLTTDCWDMPHRLRDLKGVFRVESTRYGLARGLHEALGYARQPHPDDVAMRRRAALAFDWEVVGKRAVQWIDELLSRRG